MSNFNPELTISKVEPELERGPVWLREKRKTAAESFNAAPLPRRGLHLWRYTDPTRFMFETSVDTAKVGDGFAKVEEIEKQHLADGHLSGLVVDFAGREITVHGQEALQAKGVVVTSLSAATFEYTELVEKHLYSLVNSQTGKFEAMNGALWNDGVFIYVPDGVTVEKPIHLLREAGMAGSAQYPRLLVVADKNAELTIVDEYGGGSADLKNGVSYSNGAVEIFGDEDSRVRYVSLQRQGPGMHSYLTHRAKIARGATMLTIPLAFGGILSKQNFGVNLAGQGADSNMFGLLFGSKRQHFDNHTLHHHSSGQTHSNIDFKVVLRDKAISAYTGLIAIDEKAQTCEAYQENRNLLLNKGTRAETIPELEILNEDVSCSHGATVGPIDPYMLFYLKSRGIEHDKAVRMIVSGFVEATLSMVPADLRERIGEFVETRLEDI
ncbi:Fe-S cluster assembly protein SufD [candidate division GN15 bacterium]|nr:Fe-S cluster assembly protein SufD [candidate division GN15 bacterium]